MATTSHTRFTGRKLLMWQRTGAPDGESSSLNDALGSRWKWLGQMKLGTTSIGCSPNVSTDTRLRSCDTAVTTSLSSMASQMDGLNDASLPNRVMSVPCRVVTTGRRCPCLAKIRRAFNAALAWGMA